jgi:type I restriction enzyme S subunit
MDPWPSKSLYDLVEIVGGATPRTARKSYWGGEVPWVTVVDLASTVKFVRTTARSLTPEGLASVRGRKVPPGTVIISARGTVGLLGVAAVETALNQSCYGLLAKTGELDQEYLYYLLKMLVGKLSLISHGTIFDAISRDTFKELAAPIPPLSIQRPIAGLLGRLDDKMELAISQNATLEALAELEFLDLDRRASSRRVKLGELAAIRTGRPIDRARLKPGGAYRVLGSAGLIGRSDDYLFDSDLLATGRVGTLGRIFLARAPERLWLTDNTLVLTEVRHLHLVYFILKSAKLARLNIGSSHPLLRRSDLAALDARLPPPEAIESFERYAGSLFAKILANDRQLESLAALRDDLGPRLMTGRLRLAP